MKHEQQVVIKRWIPILEEYEKKIPGELAHIDITKLPKDLRTQLKLKES